MQQQHITRLLAALLSHVSTKADKERLEAAAVVLAELASQHAAVVRLVGALEERVAELEARPLLHLVETRIRLPRTPFGPSPN